jgi:hypothetical protein
VIEEEKPKTTPQETRQERDDFKGWKGSALQSYIQPSSLSLNQANQHELFAQQTHP